MTAAEGTTTNFRLSVSRIVSVAPNGGAIFGGMTADEKPLRVLAGAHVLARLPVKGEAWYVEGEVRQHVQYGMQLHATTCRPEVPRGRLIARYLCDHPQFAGIGKGKANELWQRFGDRLASTIAAGDSASLEEVLTATTAARLIQVWSERLHETELIEHLDAHGIEWRLVVRLLRVWGNAARAMLDANPYHLLAFTGWPIVDAAARKLGVAEDDERRLVGAVEAALYARLLQSHTLTDRLTLVARVKRLLGRQSAEHAIALALAEGAIVGDETQGYQAIGAAALERGVERRLQAMLAGEVPAQQSLIAMASVKDLANDVIAEVEAKQGFALNSEQRDAVLLPFESAVGVLTGGAGVGKTTVLRVIIELANRQALTVFQMALAGRAAQRMAEATDAPASTIAKFIAAARSGKTDVPANSLVVIDEASMLDLPSFYRVLKYLPDGVRLLLVGDPAQLPPIAFGLVFHRLVESARVPKAHLTVVHRQAASSGIPAAAAEVRQHRVPAFVPYTGLHSGVSFVECGADDAMSQLRQIARAWEAEDFQVLSAVNSGKAGVHHINQSFHADACNGELSPTPYLPGEPVIHLANDYERGLMNGNLGRVLAITPDGELSLGFDGDLHTFGPNEARDQVDLAYAISVHKSQGSQFKRVVVVVGKSRILDHALIYTALTRGVEQVVFVGDRSAFDSAVSSEPLVRQRCVAFAI
jgi:exodeoxyribonuclease V alpha subunit